MPDTPVPVLGSDGSRGMLYQQAEGRVLVEWEDGSRVEVPASLVERQEDGSYRVALTPATRDEVVIPVLAEELMVEKERVPTGGVRVHRHVETREEKLSLPLRRERVDVRRVPIGKVVDGPLPVRREGDTTIVPVVEEVLVAKTEFRLVEEIRITRTAIRDHHSETVTLQKQTAEVEKIGPKGETKTLDQPFIKDERMLRKR